MPFPTCLLVVSVQDFLSGLEDWFICLFRSFETSSSMNQVRIAHDEGEECMGEREIFLVYFSTYLIMRSYHLFHSLHNDSPHHWLITSKYVTLMNVVILFSCIL